MTTYTVTPTNYNNSAFWSSISESASGHVLDFTGLPSSFMVSVQPTNNIIWIWDGVAWSSIGEAGAGTTFTLGAPTDLDFFTEVRVGDSTAELLGSFGNDTLISGSANDTVDGSSGNDLIQTAAGNDSIDAGIGNDTVNAGSGNDYVESGQGNDVVETGSGNDIVAVSDDHDNDTITDSGGGSDYDAIVFSTPVGTDGVDIAFISGTSATYDYQTTLTNTFGTFTGFEQIITTDYDDTIDTTASTSFQQVFSGSGNDTVSLGDVGSEAYGQAGNDQLTGGVGNDSLDGGTGNDTLSGGSGDDSLAGDDGWDRLLGGDGADTILGGTGRDFLYGGTGDDSLVGGADGLGDYFYLESGYGNDTIIDGDDVGRIDSRAEGVTSDLTVTFGTDYDGILTGAEGTVTFDGIQTFVLGAGNDVLNASAMTGDVYLSAGLGNNTVIGGAGNDDLRGDFGNDSLVGGAGDDYFETRGGNDTVAGGDGDDQLNAFNGSLGDTVFYVAGAGNDTLFGENQSYVADLGSGNDYAETGRGSDTINTGGGSDVIFTGEDADLIEIEDGFNGSQIFGGEGVTTGIDLDTLDAGALTTGVSIFHMTNEAGTLISGTDGLSFNEIEEIGLTAQGDSVDASTLFDGVSYDGLEGNDTLTGGDGADTLAGGDGDDLIDGGAGDDFLTTGLGQDTLLGGTGNDTLMNAEGDDSLDGGAGDDSIVATGGEDTLRGGTGSDTMEGGDDADTFIIEDGFGNDVITGGEGTTDPSDVDYDTIDLSALSGPVTVTYSGDEAGTITDGTDTITFSEIENLILTGQNDSLNGSADSFGISADGGAGTDTLLGGSGNDTIDGGAGADSIDGGDGNDILGYAVGGDTIDGGAGDDTLRGGFSAGTDDAVLRGGDGNDRIVTYGANDTVDGGAGSDTVAGDSGDESIDGGADGDLIFAGNGDDTVSGGTGDDTLSGGGGDDIFIYLAGDGNDTITDFNTDNTGTLSDGDSTNNDFINLSAFYDDIWELYADQADDGILNQSNDGVGSVDYSNNTSFGSGSLTFTGASADNSSFTSENTGVLCFASGTAIRTPAGDVMVETLRAGDLVTTQDHGPSKVLWIGCTEVVLQAGQVDPRRTPVRIKSDCASEDRALLVSPQHCLLMTDATGQRVLVRARHLAEETWLASFARGRSTATYWHVLLEQHSVMISQGRLSESFYPGPSGVAMMAASERARLLGALPALRTTPVQTAYGPRSLKVLTRSEVRSSARTGAFAFASPDERLVLLPTQHRSQFVARPHSF